MRYSFSEEMMLSPNSPVGRKYGTRLRSMIGCDGGENLRCEIGALKYAFWFERAPPKLNHLRIHLIGLIGLYNRLCSRSSSLSRQNFQTNSAYASARIIESPSGTSATSYPRLVL